MSGASQSPRRLPANPNLEKLRKDAKSLLRAFHAGEAEAVAFVEQLHPRPAAFRGLRDAQLAIARLYGFADWDALVEGVELRQYRSRSLEEQAELFVSSACLRYNGDDRAYRYRLAAAMLAEEPAIARVNLHAALAAGRLDAVRDFLEKDASGINTPGGPLGRPPLLSLTYSRVPADRDEVLAIVDLMLEKGADPDSRVLLDGIYPFTAMTGAMGEGERGPVACTPHDFADEIVARLLAAGASPNETQGLYNTQFTDSGDKWLKLLLAHGLEKHPQSKATLEYALAQSVNSGRLERVKLLLEHGTDPNVRNPYDKRSCHMNAVIFGHDEIAAALLAHGARVEALAPADAFRVAMREADEAAMGRLLEAHPELAHDAELLRESAHHGAPRVHWLLDHGFDVNGRGQAGRTLLMDVALWNYRPGVEFLLARGADPDLEEETYGATALGFALHNRSWSVVEVLGRISNSLLDVSRIPDVERARELLVRDPSLVSSRTKMGNTPLHLVSQARDQDIDPDASAAMIDLLLAHGADLEARNDEGLTPLDWFRKQGIDEIVELLAVRDPGI